MKHASLGLFQVVIVCLVLSAFACSSRPISHPASNLYPDGINAVIVEKRKEYLYCYEAGVNQHPPASSGKVVIVFIIESDGSVKTASVASSTVNNDWIDKCILSVIVHSQFPLPANYQPITVKYPFAFSKSN